MSMNLFPGRIHCLRPSLPLTLTRCGSTPLASSNAPTEASPPNLNFATQFLIQSCALSSGDALKASKLIPHLKSPDKPDAVLRFLREIGLTDSDIRTGVSKDARFLCSSLDKNWRPNVAKLQELGFSIRYISALIARQPLLFNYNLLPKLDFWMQVLGSAEFLSVVLKSGMPLLCTSLEKVLIPNLSFLKHECGFSPLQILQLIKSGPRSITCKPEALKNQAEMADQFGIARSSIMFVHALVICGYMTQDAIDAKFNNFRNLGFSQQEVTLLIRKLPLVLTTPEVLVARKLEFLVKKAGCDRADVLRNPVLLSLSLKSRLVPRTTVRNLLKSKGLPVANLKVSTFMQPSEEMFVKKFVLPYEQDIPGLYQAYADATIVKDDE